MCPCIRLLLVAISFSLYPFIRPLNIHNHIVVFLLGPEPLILTYPVCTIGFFISLHLFPLFYLPNLPTFLVITPLLTFPNFYLHSTSYHFLAPSPSQPNTLPPFQSSDPTFCALTLSSLSSSQPTPLQMPLSVHSSILLWTFLPSSYSSFNPSA